MTLEELKQKTKHELMVELVSDLKHGRETELTSLLKEYLSIEYHVVRKDITGKDDFNKHFYIAIFDRLLLCYLLIIVILYPESVNSWLKIVFDF